jgi:predicted PurR-regulated permease PerM
MGFFRKHVLENDILIALGVVSLAVILFKLKGIIISVFFAYILTAALSPVVDFLVSKKVYRGVAVLLTYFLLFLVLTLMIFPLVPFVATQFNSFVRNFPDYVASLSSAWGVSSQDDFTSLIRAEADLISQNALTLTRRIFGGFFSLATVIVLSIYMLLDKPSLKHKTLSLLSEGNHEKASRFLVDLDSRLGWWVRGQLFLSFIVGSLSSVGLSILGIPYAIPLGVIAGILEAVPMVGPIISVIPALVVAINISPVSVALVIGLYVIIQLLENNLLVPRVMQKAVGLNPLAVILGVMIGGSLLGVIGAILSLPLTLLTSTVLEHTKGAKKNLNDRLSENL